MNIFVDTSAFYALADLSDAHHVNAKSYFANQYAHSTFVTSEYVFVESWILIHHKLGRAASLKFWEGIRNQVVSLIAISQDDIEEAWKIINQYKDQEFSIVDCTSFAMMERLNIQDAFAFDHHFQIYRMRNRKHFRVHPT